MKGLMGDASDNIPGVPGIGEKTAAKLIQNYHSIENAHDHLEEIKPAKAKNNLREYYDQALLSKDLATIKTDCSLDYQFQDAVVGDIFTKDAYHLFKKLELKSLFKYFEEDQKEKNELQITVTSDLAEADAIFDAVRAAGKEGEAAGYGVIGSAGDCRGISLSWNDKTALLLTGGLLTEDQLKDSVLALLAAGMSLYVLDYKALLHFDERCGSMRSRLRT